MAPPKPTPKATTSVKPPAKPAAKPPAKAGAPQESIFSAMRKQARLAKHSAKAKKVVAVREFEGPDGEYNTILSRLNHYTKDSCLNAVLEFRVTDEEFEGQKLLKYFAFKDNDRQTVEEVQDEFFEALQLMGCTTDCEDDELTKQVNAIVAAKSPITVRVKSGRTGGKFPTVVGVANAAVEVEESEYQEEVADEPEEVAEVAEETDEEWEEEVVEVEDEEVVEEVVEDEADPNVPSSWVGYAMVYNGEEVEVTTADDKTMKCVIKVVSSGKKLNVPFSKLSPPAE